MLLIEAGGKDDYHWIHIPVGYLYCIGNPRTDWCYKTEADPGLNGRKLRYPRGKVLGGCSSINGMIYMRGQARDYDHWARLIGDERLALGRLLPYFKAHEDQQARWRQRSLTTRRFAELHAARRGGEWRIEKQRLRWDILDAFAQAAQQAGIPATDDFNRGDNEGVRLLRGQPEERAGAGTRPRPSCARCCSRPNLDAVDRRAGRAAAARAQRRRRSCAAPAPRCWHGGQRAGAHGARAR